MAAAMVAGLIVLAARSLQRRHRSLLDPIDPELRAGFLPWTTYLVVHRRLLGLFRRGFATKVDPVPGVSITRRDTGTVGAVSLLVVEPARQVAALRPGILWLHGGALVMGTPESEVRAVAAVTNGIGAVAVMPRYRLAPEHPFPAALDDSMSALKWMLQHADEMGMDRDRIVVAGGSAGGGLAAALAQRCRDEGITLTAQLLVAPMLDDRSVLKPSTSDRTWLMISPASIRTGWSCYLGSEPTLANEPPKYAVAGRTEDLQKLPSAWIGVGTEDLLCDESVEYARRLRAQGVECELVVVPGMYHGASALVPEAQASIDFNARMVGFLREHLHAEAAVSDSTGKRIR